MPGPGTWSAGDILTADDLNQIGTWTNYVPVLTQNVARTATVNSASYCQINKFCVVNVDLTCTTTGSANSISVSLPINTAQTSGAVQLGSGIFFDTSASDYILVSCYRGSSSTVQFYKDLDNGALDTTLGNGDVISFSLTYQTV
jgi:cytochrome c peroxidase